MADFINTIDVLGDEAVVDSIIEGTIVEFRDNVITKLGAPFYYNTVLTTVDLPSLVSAWDEAFQGCTALVDVNLPELGGVSTKMFGGCSALKSIILPKATTIGGSAFWGSTSLTLVDLGAATTIWQFAFYQCGAMKALILRGNAICEIPDNININSMYVYVPSALLEEYKNYTNWSNHSNRFRALEDYTVDGTVTGALDETKI